MQSFWVESWHLSWTLLFSPVYFICKCSKCSLCCYQGHWKCWTLQTQSWNSMLLNFCLMSRKSFNHWSLLWLSSVNPQNKPTQLSTFSQHILPQMWRMTKKLTKVNENFIHHFVLSYTQSLNCTSIKDFLTHTLFLKHLCWVFLITLLVFHLLGCGCEFQELLGMCFLIFPGTETSPSFFDSMINSWAICRLSWKSHLPFLDILFLHGSYPKSSQATSWIRRNTQL